LIAVTLALASGVAWAACMTKPMPPYVVSVSIWDIAVAAFHGHSHPSRAAALTDLDEAAASDMYMTDADWTSNNDVGNVTYQFWSGTALVTEDKPCDTKAIDALPVPGANNGANGANGASGGGGGFRWYGGRIYNSGSCVYNCGGTVTVGDVEQA